MIAKLNSWGFESHMNGNQGALLLVTHKRLETLEKVILSLERAWISDYKKLYVVHHLREDHVLALIQKITFTTPEIISVDRSNVSKPQEAISLNIFEGLSTAFSNPEISFVTVIEDDIEVSSDFLEFNSQVMGVETLNVEFRAINGFSGAKFTEQESAHYGRFRFGLGWGWSIPRKTWDSLRGYWSMDFTQHWDALVESRIRSGYVVMPHNSRVLNLGVGSSATHTVESSPEIEKLIFSFQNGKPEGKLPAYTFRSFKLNWRKDATTYVDIRKIRGKIIQGLFLVSLRFDLKPNSSAIEIVIKARLRGLVFRMIELLSFKP